MAIEITDSASPFHWGEKKVQTRAGNPIRAEQIGRRIIRPTMDDAHRRFVEQLSTIGLAVADAAGRPWATLLVGRPGFLRATSPTRLRVDAALSPDDPVMDALRPGAAVGTLPIELATRSRTRLNGSITTVRERGLTLRVSQAFGNCPAYIQARDLVAAAESNAGPRTTQRRTRLSRGDADLISEADTFFIASQAHSVEGAARGVDVSHRGGPPGFVVVADARTLVFPDYRGNGLFQTLGNIEVDERLGLLVVDFHTGDMLQLTGTAQVLWEPHHASRFPGAQRVVEVRVAELVRTRQALSARWEFRQASPALAALERDDSFVSAAERSVHGHVCSPFGRRAR